MKRLILTLFALVALTGAASAQACKPIKVHLLRGYTEVLSGGLYDIARKLKAQGITTEVSSWASMGYVQSDIARNRNRVNAMIGHSQGSNAALQAAINLSASNVPVDLVVTYAPVGKTWYAAKNIRKYVNIFTLPWGADTRPVSSATKFERYYLPNAWHVTIDKTPSTQKIAVDAVTSLPGWCRPAQARKAIRVKG